MTASPEQFSHGYALLVGVGASTYTPWSLPVTVRDAERLREVLADPGLCAYPADHIRLLHDQAATRQAILDGLDWLAQRAQTDPQATVVVFFSGHGWLEQASGRYALIPHDANPMDLPGSTVAAEQLTAALRRIEARRLLVILDCCHAGGMASAKDAPPPLPPGLAAAAIPKHLSADLRQGAGRAVFSSSRGEQLSLVRADQTLSLYTHHLIEALTGAASQPGEKTVRLATLMGYLSERVPASAYALGREQTPFFDMAAEDFPVALVRGGKGIKAASATTPTSGASFGTTTNHFTQGQGVQGSTFTGPVTFNFGTPPSSASGGDSTPKDVDPARQRAERAAGLAKRLEVERSNLSRLLLQRALQGGAVWELLPIHNAIRESRVEIHSLKEQLRGLDVPVEDLPDDDM